MESENKRKIPILKIASIIVVGFLIIYIPIFSFWIYGGNPPQDIIQTGNIEKALNTDGIIVRDEEILKSPFTGACIFDAEEGDKIAAYSAVVTVLNQSSKDLLNKLKDTDLKIIKAQKQKKNIQKIFSSDIEKIDNEIGDALKLIVEESNNNELSHISNIKGTIDELIRKKATILGDTGPADNYTRGLIAQRDNLELQIKQNTKKITSKASGIVSFVVDGNESKLNPRSIKGFTASFLNRIDTQQTVNKANSSEIEYGQPVARIVKSIYYDIVVVVDKTKIKGLKEGDIKGIRINDIEKTIQGTIDYISPAANGKCILSLKTFEAMSDILNLRRINLDIILDRYTGLKVPIDSLRNIKADNTAEIILVKAKSANITPVKIIARDISYAILDDGIESNISLNDTYLLKPGNIKERQVIN